MKCVKPPAQRSRRPQAHCLRRDSGWLELTARDWKIGLRLREEGQDVQGREPSGPPGPEAGAEVILVPKLHSSVEPRPEGRSCDQGRRNWSRLSWKIDLHRDVTAFLKYVKGSLINEKQNVLSELQVTDLDSETRNGKETDVS